MKNAHEINVELCRALGITDISRLTKVVLTIKVGELPQLTLHRLVINEAAEQAADRLQTAVECLQLKPAEASVPVAGKAAP